MNKKGDFKKLGILLVVILIIFVKIVWSFKGSSGGYNIIVSVISVSGGNATDGSYNMKFTSETAFVQNSTITSGYNLSLGYIHMLDAPTSLQKTIYTRESNRSLSALWLTDSYGDYNSTFIAPSTTQTLTIKVNATWAGTIPGEQFITITIVSGAAQSPIIRLNNGSGFAVDPIAGSVTIILLSFNVTDADGVATINSSKAIVNLTLGGFDGQFRFNISEQGGEFGTCLNHTEPGPGAEAARVIINCTIAMRYYDNASSDWFINISVQDTSGQVGRNDTARFTYNFVSGLALPYEFVNFSNVNLGQSNVLAYPHLLINHTGNEDFDMVNMTAADLTGTSITSEFIDVIQFGVNLTNSSTNQRLSFPADGIINLRDTVNGTNVTFQHGHTGAFAPNADKGNISVFFWVDVPGSGLSSQLYNATWNVTAINNP